MYLAALEHVYLRAKAASGARQDAALDTFAELGRCVAQAHSGIVAGAGAALARILCGGVDFAMQVRWSDARLQTPCLFRPCHASCRMGSWAHPA